jgi:hypothetical protein
MPCLIVGYLLSLLELLRHFAGPWPAKYEETLADMVQGSYSGPYWSENKDKYKVPLLETLYKKNEDLDDYVNVDLDGQRPFEFVKWGADVIVGLCSEDD